MTDPTQRLTAALADRYRIERELGAGGMATVYLAHDVRHDRKVALKVLRPELAAVIGADRFLKEIKVTANLQHPHILGLIDSGEANGLLYYVMPYVEGDTLRDRLIHERQLPVPEALRIATEVAGALDYAHRHGVIHRDIKPENILLHDGHVQVADFGIALAVTSAGGTRMTETGMSLGTPHYMSPEQAMGEREIAAKSDVYALGCVLYEMLVGEPPFTGASAQAIVAKVLTETPRALVPQRGTVPPHVEAAVLQALQKLPADRFATAAEFAAAIAEPRVTGWRPATAAARPARWRLALPWAVAALATAVAAVALLRGPGATSTIQLGRRTAITLTPGPEVTPAISPDGRLVAFASDSGSGYRLFVRQADGGTLIAVAPGLPGYQLFPRWSPDGTRLLFLSTRGVEVAPALGGLPRVLVPAGSGLLGPGPWTPDGARFFFHRGDSIFVRALDGGPEALVAATAGNIWDLSASPDGRWLAWVAGNHPITTFFGNLAPSEIWVVRASGGEPRKVAADGAANLSPVWMPGGRTLLYVSSRDGVRDVYAMPLRGNGKPAAAPHRITTGLSPLALSLSADGLRLAYARYEQRANVWSIALPAGAPVSSAGATPVTSGNQRIEWFDIAPDGSSIVFDSDRGGNQDVYRMPLGGGPIEQLTTDAANDVAPALSPDGREIAFYSFREDGATRRLFVMNANGGDARRVTADTGPVQELFPRWSPDGRSLLFLVLRLSPAGAHFGIGLTERDGTGWTATRQIVDSLTAVYAEWSPDGRSIATVTAEGIELVEPHDTGRRLLVPLRPESNVDLALAWSADGRTLYYVRGANPGGVWAVPRVGGTARLLVRLDAPGRPYQPPGFRVARGRAYFALGESESDIWTIAVTRTER